MTTPLYDALKANESSYLKILKINLNQDSFELIRSQEIELDPNLGFHEKLSKWIINFANTGQIYFEDLEAFRLNTDLKKIRDFFREGKKEFGFAYRRVVHEKIRWANMKFRPAPEYTHESPILFLYVIDLDDAICDYEKRVKTLERELEEKEVENNFLSSFSAVFLSTHVIDLDEDTLKEHVVYERLREFVTSPNEANRQIKLAISNLISPKYVEDALKFADLSTLRERMGTRRMISHELVDRYVGWVRFAFIAVDKNDKGHWKRVIFATRIIDEEKRHTQKLFYLANTDELTHLYNRHAYHELASEIQSNSMPLHLSVLAFDINGLKRANDTLGHEAGDELIYTTARFMDEIFTPRGRCFRIGGDEFVAIINANESELSQLLDQFEKAVSRWKGQKNDQLAVSVGVASIWEHPNVSFNELERLADQNMYKSKEKYYKEHGHDRRRS